MPSKLDRITTVFFDLDDTLMEGEAAYTGAAQATAAWAAKQVPRLDAEALTRAYIRAKITIEREALGEGGLPPISLRDWRVRSWQIALGEQGARSFALALEVVDHYVQERQRRYRLYPDALPTLEALRPHYQLGIITNGPSELQREKLCAVKLETAVPIIVIAGEVGASKPAESIFQAALELARCKPHQAAYIGDQLARDVAGAKAAGLTAIWLARGGIQAAREWQTRVSRLYANAGLPVEARTRGADAEPDFEISSLDELPPLLGCRAGPPVGGAPSRRPDGPAAQFWRNVQAVVFDFDGTLANCPYDFAVMRQRLYEIADRWGVPRAELESRYLLEGIEHGAQLLADPEDAHAFRRQAEEMLVHQELCDAKQAHLLPGTVEATQRLRAAGIKLGIITRNCRAVIEQVIGDSGLAYDCCLTREEVDRVKPDRAHLALALDQLGARPEQALMVGDHVMDMRTGRELGMRTVGVLTGHCTAQELLDAGAEVVVAGVGELAERLCQEI